jgi:hypothetical protein
MKSGDLEGRMNAGGWNSMSEKIAAHRGQQPRVLTASEIRTRVEDIAEELALKMRAEQPTLDQAELEAYPLDTRKFVMLMSGFIRMN